MKLYLLTVWMVLALAGGLLAAPGTKAQSGPPPPSPTGLSAQVTVRGSGPCIKLSWTTVPGIRFYKIYRDNVPLKTYWWSTYWDEQVQPGETHTYTVTSLSRTEVESAPSDPVTVTLPAANGAGGQPIYTDSLQSGWTSWSWATTDFANASVVHSGTESIAVSVGPWAALYLHHDPQDATPYTAVSFWINGGVAGGQQLWLKAMRGSVPQTTVTLPALAAGQWQQVTVPLADLGVAGASDLEGFWIQDATGGQQPTFYVDDISLVAATTVSAPAAPTGLSATPQWAPNCPKCGGMAMAHIVLAWNPVSGATSYNVYRNGAQTQAGLASPAWTDMDVTSGLAYSYTVTAVGPGGEGLPSAPAAAVAPSPPSGALSVPVNLTVTGTWLAAPTDALTWTAVPGAASYNLYLYDVQIATGLTGTTYTVPPTSYFWGLTYTLTAVGPDGAETLPSAGATAQGSYDPTWTPVWTPAPPTPPDQLAATPEWNSGAPRVHLTWHGYDNDFTYSVYRDGKRVISGLWGLNYYDTAVSPGETHSYTVTGVNVPVVTPVESAPSVAISATTLTAAPSPVPGPVQITGVQPDDDSAIVSFAAVPGAADYRAYSVAHPNTVKYSGGSLSIQMNGLDPVNGSDLVVEAVDKLGPFQKMDGMAGPGAMAMDGMHQAINGQGDPSDVPNVLAVSAPFHVTCVPMTLPGSQVFLDTFRNEQPLVALPLPAPVAGDTGGVYGHEGNYSAQANDKWEIRQYATDQTDTKVFFMGSHFMDTVYDGSTPYKGGPIHNNNTSLVMMPKATADISGGKVLHVTFEVDAHFDGRRWCDVVVAGAGDTLINPAKLDGGLSPTVSGNMFRWRIQDNFHIPQLFLNNAETDLVYIPNGVLEDAPNVERYQWWNSVPLTNGTAQDLDKRHRFDLYLSQTHLRILENGQLIKDRDLPLDANGKIQSLPFSQCQVYLVHQVYHTGNDRPEKVRWDPADAYWYNYRPWCDERHWDDAGQEVLDAFPTLPTGS